MKSLLFLSVVALIVVCAAAQSTHNARHRDAETQNRLVGEWKLVSLEEPGADGQVHKADCAGQFVFTRDGKASVQVLYRNAQTGSSYAQGGYEASYGSYRIDDRSTFTFHIEGSLVRTLIGKDPVVANEAVKAQREITPSCCLKCTAESTLGAFLFGRHLLNFRFRLRSRKKALEPTDEHPAPEIKCQLSGGFQPKPVAGLSRFLLQLKLTRL